MKGGPYETPSISSANHFEFVIFGGGTAGITVASRFLYQVSDTSLAIIEPSDAHYYQSLWTLVGAGVVDREETARPMASVELGPGAGIARVHRQKRCVQ